RTQPYTHRTFAEANLTCATRKARRVRRRRLCRNNDARQARPRSGYGKSPDVVAGEPHPKTRRPGRPVADPTVQLRDAFRPAYAPHSTFPTNTLLAHHPRQPATCLMFPELTSQRPAGGVVGRGAMPVVGAPPAPLVVRAGGL